MLKKLEAIKAKGLQMKLEREAAAAAGAGDPIAAQESAQGQPQSNKTQSDKAEKGGGKRKRGGKSDTEADGVSEGGVGSGMEQSESDGGGVDKKVGVAFCCVFCVLCA